MFRRTHNRRATDTAVANKRNSLATLLFAGVWLCAFVRVVNADDEPVYETVVVPQTSPFASSKDEAASATVVTRDRTPRSGESLEQLVSELPGAAVTRMGGMGAMSTLSIRGSTPAQVQVYIDDIPLNLATGGGVDLGFVPVTSVGKVELFKGSSPLAFGSSGIGGILAVYTDTPDHDELRGSLGTGSWGAKNASVSGSAVYPGFRASVSLSAMESVGDYTYESNRGLQLTSDKTVLLSRTNNDLSQFDGSLRLVFPISASRTISFLGSLDHREQGVPGAGLRTTEQTRLELGRATVQLAYESSGDLGTASRVRANLYALRMTSSFHDPIGELGSKRDTDDTNAAIGSTWRVSKSLGSALRFRWLLDLRHEEYLPKDSRKNIRSGPPGTRDYAAVGTEPSYWFVRTDTEVTPSVRLEVSRDVLSDRQLFTDEPTASAPAISWLPVLRISGSQKLGDIVSVRTNLARYVRSPSTTERYGNTGFLLPNPTIKPESGTNLDVGVRFASNRKPIELSIDTAVFASWAEDLIQFVQNSGQGRAYNLASARIVGAEAAINATLHRHLKLFSQVTYSHATDTSGIPAQDGKQLAMRPRTHAYARPELATIGLGASFKIGIYGDVDLSDGAFLDSTNRLPIPTRILLGAGASVSHENSGIRVIFSANNLADVFSYDYLGFPLPGRTLFLSVEWLNPLHADSLKTSNKGVS
jgi:vitamin B12 transporter